MKEKIFSEFKFSTVIELTTNFPENNQNINFLIEREYTKLCSNKSLTQKKEKTAGYKLLKAHSLGSKRKKGKLRKKNIHSS